MKKCPKCYLVNDDWDIYCKQCGLKLSYLNLYFNEAHLVTLGFISLVALAILIFFSMPEKQIAEIRKPTPTPTPNITPTPTPPEKEDTDIPKEFERAHIYTITDSNGKTGEIGVGVFLKDDYWEDGSRVKVKRMGDLSVLGKKAFSLKFIEKMKSYKEVIVVGAADRRNPKNGTREDEISRSYDRTITLSKAVEQIREDQETIKSLVLGQWAEEKCQSVALPQQRRIIFMWLTQKSDTGFNLKEGIRKVLEAKPSDELYRQMLQCYTNFDLS